MFADKKVLHEKGCISINILYLVSLETFLGAVSTCAREIAHLNKNSGDV